MTAPERTHARRPAVRLLDVFSTYHRCVGPFGGAAQLSAERLRVDDGFARIMRVEFPDRTDRQEMP